MSAPAAGPAPIIVIKKAAEEEHGHHGGAWKVAYADFVTAMMAFFLLLWLLSATSEEQKKGIADYFDPNTSVSNSRSGSGGVMGGTAMAPQGAMTASSQAFELRRNKTASTDEQEEQSTMAQLAPSKAEGTAGTITEADAVATAMAASKAAEEQAFDAMEAQLKQAISEREDLGAMREGLLVDRTEEGLRIQLVDQQNFPMFERGSPQMRSQARTMVGTIVQVIANSPNKLSIRGHTDALPLTSRAGYDNWNLSSDRAIDTRRALLQGGLDPSRVANVAGLADTDPLVPADPLDGRNRRMSIILLRQAPR
jgi:chemotaxis protein MotB